MYIMNEMLPAL